MSGADDLILLGGALGVVAILAGLVSHRFGAPLLLVFLALGMVAGEDGFGLAYSNFGSAYLIGSLALGIILFEGGLKTTVPVLRAGWKPALALATVGVLATAAITGLAASWIGGLPLALGLLLGATVAPTDAAAVASVLRTARVAVPERLMAVLEVESGLNDPMSIFLVLLLMEVVSLHHGVALRQAALFFAREMLGGGAIGLAGGWVMVALLRRLRGDADATFAPVLALCAAMLLFGAAQRAGTSGFLAVYLAGVVAGAGRHETRAAVEHFFGAMAGLAQIALFLMLGLLVTPHDLLPLIPGGLVVTLVLIVVARPAAVIACLAPFRLPAREIGFAAWVGLRGAVPIYLAIAVVLQNPDRGRDLFGTVFVVVIASLIVQGWTIRLVAQMLGFGAAGASVLPGGRSNAA